MNPRRALPRPLRPLVAAGLLLAAAGLGRPAPAHAVLDVEDRGPLMTAGGFRSRVTNAGILGNAFYDVGRSSDPSFEYPAYSGIELLNHAELWIGAIAPSGDPHVSGGPMLEWRPTLDPNDHVRIVGRDRLGTTRGVDDDGDGRVDEEILNGKDDDGDGEIDEDLGLFADQVAASDYVDDRPEAVNYGYPTGETHVPLGLSVHQESYAWSTPGFDGVNVITFHVTNHGADILHQLYIGVFADLDVRVRTDPGGYRNDRVESHSYAASRFDGIAKITIDGVIPCPSLPCPPPPHQCFTNLAGTVPVVVDGQPGSGLPVVAVMPLDHTLDPLGRILPNLARAPIRRTFTSSVFLSEGIPGEGGPPRLDADRYEALAGRYPNAAADAKGDWQVLISSGPFRVLEPGQSLDFTVAIVAAPSADSLETKMARVAMMYEGALIDSLPNETAHPDSAEYNIRKTGVSGHEVCLEPPPGVTFQLDPDCVAKFGGDPPLLAPIPVAYRSGQCIWTDLDCDACTGNLGKETARRYLEPGQMPPSPATRVTPGSRRVAIEWDNLPELLISAGKIGAAGTNFIGYRLYKLAKWSPRDGLMPPLANWALLAAFSSQTTNGELSLGSVTDSTVDYERILYEKKEYPIGRYRYEDHEVLDGFDYVYAVTTVAQVAIPNGSGVISRATLESPLIVSFSDRVTPHTASAPGAGAVTVVPNPYRARAGWERAPVFGDPQPRHLDFMHLPKALCTIKIYTLAGDFVQQLTHDGRGGDGQTAWDLISRNGQDVESGVYLFTVDSPLGHQIGKFVVVR